ncbi:toxin ParE4 [Marinobacterium nitratireducens]|uniref:Toxin n=1 Tax=Marinobacterium nitratireducens TaxID=518897 RepID=A0A918DVJ1_9GAMM|nr:type II toxin-antitoxin system RelE/ParE family toxin [Marinobacterium nitratireducens]GGO84321.1 toxin ParE4 [Marinobacterium nitratireducens]
MRFNVSREALEDLRAIGRYTQKIWGAAQRRKYLNGLDERFRFLATNPLISPLRAEFSPPVRIHHHDSHLIVYLVEDTHITIIRVLHGSMDIEAHLDN